VVSHWSKKAIAVWIINYQRESLESRLRAGGKAFLEKEMSPQNSRICG